MKEVLDRFKNELAGYSEVVTLIEANQIARNNHAVSYGVSFYPSVTLNAPSRIFAYYYFYANGDELGHWMPDFETFAFCKGRKWDSSFKAQLEFYDLVKNTACG